MPWFYAEEGKQVGPIEDAEFERLVSSGAIAPGTLVWREGMPNWEPLLKVRPSLPPPSIAAPPSQPEAATPGQVRCTECQRIFAVEETVEIGTARVCAACKPVYVQKLREGAATFTPAAVVGTIRYAGFWIRFVAKFIDGLIVTVVLLPVSVIFGFTFSMNPSVGPANWQAMLAPMFANIAIQTFIGFAVRMFYTWLMVARYSATLGKMAVGLKVVTPEGLPISSKRAFARYWAEVVSQFTCYIGYILAAFDDQKRSLHDRICETRVVYK